MSSPASAVLRLELHPWPVADRVAAALVVAAALTIMAVAAQTPEPRPGLGVLAFGLLGGWLWYRRRAARGIAALAVAGDGRFWTEYQDGRRHQATLQALLQAGASTVLADRSGRTPLQLARDRGYREMVRLLELAGAR